jgi:hypothetical protein
MARHGGAQGNRPISRRLLTAPPSRIWWCAATRMSRSPNMHRHEGDFRKHIAEALPARTRHVEIRSRRLRDHDDLRIDEGESRSHLLLSEVPCRVARKAGGERGQFVGRSNAGTCRRHPQFALRMIGAIRARAIALRNAIAGMGHERRAGSRIGNRAAYPGAAWCESGWCSAAGKFGPVLFQKI